MIPFAKTQATYQWSKNFLREILMGLQVEWV